MEATELKFDNACQTIALKQENIFVSAFPGKIVFGTPNNEGFLNLKTFQFYFYQLLELYLALLSVIKFLVSSELNCQKGILLKVSEEQIYFWVCKNVQINNRDSKIATFGIEFQSTCVFELVFDFDQLNNFISGISQCILPALCLKTLERQVLEEASEETLQYIIELNRRKNTQIFLRKIKNKNKFKIDSVVQPNLSDLIIYYHETIIIVHKLKSLYNPSFDEEKESRLRRILDS